MKYIEELECGDTFTLKEKIYLLTSDFKNGGQRLCYSLSDGFASWLSNQTIVDHTPVYILDQDNNTIPIKNTRKADVPN